MKIEFLSIGVCFVIFITLTPSLNNNSVFRKQNMNDFVSSIPYYLFPTKIEDVEEILKIPLDTFTLQSIFIEKGENITIKVYNTKANEAYTFTLDSLYNINTDLK